MKITIKLALNVIVILAYIFNFNDRKRNPLEESFSLLSDIVKADIYDNSEYWKQFEGPVSEISETVNDTYLKANDLEDGTKSYGRVVDLLLAEYKEKNN